MRDVIFALIPGIVVLAFLYGSGILIQVTLGIFGAVAAESLALFLRRRPITQSLKDFSAVLTGTLLAISVPPLAPWWVVLIGASLGILLGKQVYGGLGQNPFNPAMLGFALLILAFPRLMTLWPGMRFELPPGALSLGNTLTALFGEGSAVSDSITRATPLNRMHEAWKAVEGVVPEDSGPVWGWILLNGAYLAGGLWLAIRKTLDPRIPLGFLGAMALGVLLIDAVSDAKSVSAWPTLFLGSTMLGAFFIATDPVSAATTPRGRWLYAAGIGLMVILIRRFGGYPDGLAFAVLMMNFAAPTLDRFSRPKPLGRER
jgi:Na+-translocating ferredoxin:NAD+ oxidoreductase subunit D